MNAIEVRDLRKNYGDNTAVAGIDLHVAQCEVSALLGPNGAGKTTTVEILEGHRHRTSGDATVFGEDPGKAGRHWRSRIGIVLQTATDSAELTVAERSSTTPVTTRIPGLSPMSSTSAALPRKPARASGRCPADSAGAWTSL